MKYLILSLLFTAQVTFTANNCSKIENFTLKKQNLRLISRNSYKEFSCEPSKIKKTNRSDLNSHISSIQLLREHGSILFITDHICKEHPHIIRLKTKKGFGLKPCTFVEFIRDRNGGGPCPLKAIVLP